MPLLVNHLCPLMTHSSPSSTAVVDMFTGSEPACSGSVIEKAEKIFLSSSGSSHCRFCSSVPKSASTSELPVSGALLPKMIGPQNEVPSISCMSPSLTWPMPWPPISGGRWVAHSPRFLTSSWSERTTRKALSRSMSSTATSSGQTSSRMNVRIHASFSSNSGSVSKSQGMLSLTFLRSSQQANAFVDELNDRSRSRLVGRVGPLATPVQHQVVAEDRRVLVVGEGQEPGVVGWVGAVHLQQVAVVDVDLAATRHALARAAGVRDHREAGQVEQRLPDLGDLPVQDPDHPALAEEHVPVVVVAVDERRLLGRGPGLGQAAAQFGGASRELFRRPLHEPAPAHQLRLQWLRFLVADPRALQWQRVERLQHLDGRARQLMVGDRAHDAFDTVTIDLGH